MSNEFRVRDGTKSVEIFSEEGVRLLTEMIFDATNKIAALENELDILKSCLSDYKSEISYFHCGVCKEDVCHNMTCPCCGQ